VFVALGIQLITRKRHIAICGLLGSTIFFTTLTHNRHDFPRKKNIEYKMCFFILSKTCIRKFLILRGIKQDMIKNVYCSCTVPAILVPFRRDLNFLDIFFEKYSNTNLMKILPVETESFHAERWTGMTKLTVAFRNFANAHKHVQVYVSP